MLCHVHRALYVSHETKNYWVTDLGNQESVLDSLKLETASLGQIHCTLEFILVLGMGSPQNLVLSSPVVLNRAQFYPLGDVSV